MGALNPALSVACLPPERKLHGHETGGTETGSCRAVHFSKATWVIPEEAPLCSVLL